MPNFPNALNAAEFKIEISPRLFYQSELQQSSLKVGGWCEAGLCPFHADKKAGSFFVNLNNGSYKCFSCGAKGGDIIHFTQQLYNLSFVDALKKLQSDWGLS